MVVKHVLTLSNNLSTNRVFGKGISEKEFQVVRAWCSQVCSFVPPKQKRNTPTNFETKRLFRNAFSERSKRSEKERDERSLHGVPGPCSQVRPFLLAELKRDTPRNFDMKGLIRNAFSERPNKVTATSNTTPGAKIHDD